MVGHANESVVFVNETKCKALIDSGSMISTIAESMVKRIKPIPEIKTPNEFTLSVNVAGGSKLHVSYFGYVEVEVSVGFLGEKEIMPVPLLVVETTDYNRNVPVVIGTNIIRLYKQNHDRA